MENAILSIRDLRVVFEDGFVALGGVSIDIGKNEFVTLLGPSGCGKTTLLRCIGGFEKPSAGEILYKGENIVPLPPYKRAERGLRPRAARRGQEKDRRRGDADAGAGGPFRL